MDSRAKQRLTGAVILVALFVLLVPELLTGPRGTEAPPSASNEEGMRRYTIDLNASTTAAQPENSQTTQPAVALPPVPVPLATPGESAAPAAKEPPAQQEQAPLNNAAAAPAASPPAPHADPQRSAAAATERGSFVVQLGSFRSRDNADRLVRDMSAKGFAAFVAPITTGGHELYRVRVGPTRDRPAAEALAAKLRQVGQSGSIVPIS